MGIVISRFKSQNDNYEEILSELDGSIRKVEISLGEMKIREHNALVIWIVYSLLAYVAYVLGYWYFIYMSNRERWDFMKVAPVITGPFLIVIGYRFLALWFKRNKAKEISQLEHLKAKQRLKIEELKKKTDYYTTKTLLDRYDSPTRPPINQQQKQKQMSPGQEIPSTIPDGLRPDTPNSLRQRLPSQPSPQSPNNDKDNNNGSNVNDNGNTNKQTYRLSQINQTDNMQYQQRNWYDKLVDVITGDDEHKYALICKNCYTWNGLAFATEFDDIQYYCKNCNHFNPSKRSSISGTETVPPPPPPSSKSSLSNRSSLFSDNVTSNNSHNNNNNNNNNNIDLSSSLDDNSNASIVSLPVRGRSTKPKPISRNLPSDLDDDVDGVDDVDISKKLASRSTSRKGDNSIDNDEFKPGAIKDDDREK